MNGARESSGAWRDAAAPLEVELAAEPVAVTAPEPGVAVAVLAPPAFWDPAPLLPLSPGPGPAPWLMYLTAPSGMTGRLSVPGNQVSDWEGQLLFGLLVLYPPSPDGMGVLAYADCKAAKSAFSLTLLPEIVTRPNLFSSMEYS